MTGAREAQLMGPALLRTCLALSPHSTFGNLYLPFISASSVTPPEHQYCGPCLWDIGRAKIHPPIFTVGKRRQQRKEVVLRTPHSQTDRLSHPLHRRSLIRSLWRLWFRLCFKIKSKTQLLITCAPRPSTDYIIKGEEELPWQSSG